MNASGIRERTWTFLPIRYVTNPCVCNASLDIAIATDPASALLIGQASLLDTVLLDKAA